MVAILKTSVVQNAASATANITLDTNGGFSIGNGTLASPSTLSLQTNGSTTGLYIDASQNVGIGTTSPSNLLHVYKTQGSAATYGIAQNDGTPNAATLAGWMIQDGSTIASGIRRSRDGGASPTQIGTFSATFAEPVAFYTSNSERMRIDPTGNVGIGTSSPSYSLHVNRTGAAAQMAVQTNTTAAYVYALYGSTVNTALISDATTSYLSAETNNALVLRTNATERMRIDSSGNVMIGTTNAYGKLEVTNSTNNSGIRIDQLTSSTNYSAFFCNVQNSGNNLVTWGYQGVTVGTVTTNGSTTAYNTSSDYRLKENVQPITDGLAIVSALKPVRYDWISNKLAGEGFLAHELQAVVPLAVTGEKDAVDAEGKPVYQGVDYSKLVVHLVAAINELSAQVTAQAAEITALKAKVGA